MTETDTAPPNLNGLLTVYYRAVGKLSDETAQANRRADRDGGVKIPAHSTDELDLDSALLVGSTHVDAGEWTEFYVKLIYRRRARQRS